MALEFQHEIVAMAASSTAAQLVATPAWLMRPGRLECGPAWELVQEIYAKLTGRTLPSAMPPRERRTVDAVLEYDDGTCQILEVDESQHFNKFRALTLRAYGDAPVAFDREAWLEACDQKSRLEGGGFAAPRPPLFPEPNGRHRQRAFRDALCDLIPPVHGFHPTARVAHFESAKDVDGILRKRLLSPTGPTDSTADQGDGVSRSSPREASRRAVHTQRVTANDLKVGQIRIPGVAKGLFPPDDTTVTVVLRGWETSAPWRPRYGPDKERSGVLRIEREELASRVAPDEVLDVKLDDRDRIAID